MSGEIHGVISREDAWRMWRPYGDRVDLHGSVNPDTLTNGEAMQILLSADRKTQDFAWRYWYKENDHREWYEGIHDIDLDTTPELVDVLVASQQKQQRNAERKRERAIAEGPSFVKELGKGAVKLQRMGLLRPSHVESIQSWLVGPDGLPYMQYTPMSQLEYARLALVYDNDVPSTNSSDCTDFRLGILRSATGSYFETDSYAQHCRVHESVHGSFSGLEIYDITNDRKQRGPIATVVGTFAYEPSTEIGDGDDFSGVENTELNEGWTEFLARSLIRVKPKLGQIYDDSAGYSAWSNVMEKIHAHNPELYFVITDTMLAETTPRSPDEKRLALADMHDYADQKLGTHDSLNRLFQSSGGRLLDIYTKGKK